MHFYLSVFLPRPAGSMLFDQFCHPPSEPPYSIIACMCFFQTLFQFYFYSAASLPLGRLTHIQMFRLGLCLYLIPYIFVPELRPLLSAGGAKNKTITFGLILLTATRYLANTYVSPRSCWLRER